MPKFENFNVLSFTRNDRDHPDTLLHRYRSEWNVFVDEWGGPEVIHIPHADMDALIQAYILDKDFVMKAAAKTVSAGEGDAGIADEKQRRDRVA